MTLPTNSSRTQRESEKVFSRELQFAVSPGKAKLKPRPAEPLNESCIVNLHCAIFVVWVKAHLRVSAR